MVHAADDHRSSAACTIAVILAWLHNNPNYVHQNCNSGQNTYISGKKVEIMHGYDMICTLVSAPWRKQKLTILMILPKGSPFLCYVFHNI